MADLAALSRAERARRLSEGRPENPFERPSQEDVYGPAEAASVDPLASMLRPGTFNPASQPGDPDFNWERYDEWKATQPRALEEAKPLAEQYRREDEEKVRAEQEAKFASGELGQAPGVLREVLAEATPGKLALLAGLLSGTVTGGLGTLATAGVLGAGTAGGSLAGDIAQRLAKEGGVERATPSDSFGEALTSAGEAGGLAAGGTALLGGAGQALGALRNLGGKGGAALDLAGEAIPGNVGRAIRFARRATTGRRAPTTGRAGVAEEGAMGGFAQQPKSVSINRPRAPYKGPATADEGYWPVRETAWTRPTPYTGPKGHLAGSKAPSLESVLDEALQRARTPETPSRIFGPPEQTITPAGREGTFISSGRPATGRAPTPSTNPFIDELPPPSPDAWSAVRQMKARETIPEEIELAIPEADPLSRLDVLRARQTERYGRPFRSESPTAPEPSLELPKSWQPFTENPVTQDLIAILNSLRRGPTPGLTNPTGR